MARLKNTPLISSRRRVSRNVTPTENARIVTVCVCVPMAADR
jgi:hypothetical protein